MLKSVISRKLITEVLKRNLGTVTKSVKEQKVLVKDANINYVKVGNGPQNLLLLPGALGSIWTDFQPQVEGGFDPSKFTVIVWEPPGYGHSRPPERTFPPDFFFRDAEYAAEFMKVVVGHERPVHDRLGIMSCGLDRAFQEAASGLRAVICPSLTLGIGKYSLLGWSDGGITSLIIAAKNAQAVQKLVVWGANAFVSAEDAEIYVAMRDVSSMSERYRKSMEELYGVDGFANMWANWVDAMVQIRKERQQGDICRWLLPLIQCETLVVHGEKDPMVPKFHAALLVSEIKNSRMHMFEKGKHNLHLRYAKEFNKLVEEFILK